MAIKIEVLFSRLLLELYEIESQCFGQEARAPAYRLKGIAQKILYEIEALFKEKGIKKRVLEV
jgi:hypothetical protein